MRKPRLREERWPAIKVLSNHRDPGGGGIMTPEDAWALIPGTLIVKDLEVGGLFWIIELDPHNHKDP